MDIKDDNIEKIYSFAFNNNIFINEIKAQLYYEDLTNKKKLVLDKDAKRMTKDGVEILRKIKGLNN